MPYTLHVQPHPLGVVVINDEGSRELLIEGEKCCGIPFEELLRIAGDTGLIEISDEKSNCCRLIRL